MDHELVSVERSELREIARRKPMETFDVLVNRVQELEAENERLRGEKDGAYSERNKLVAALSKLRLSWLERHPDSDTEWEDDWRWIVFVNGPGGQMSWHIHDSELGQFNHLIRHTGNVNSWDGHTVEEKYERLAAIDKAKGERNGG